MKATPHYIALEPLATTVDGQRVEVDAFDEIPAVEAWGDGLRREIDAGRVAIMLVPTDDEFLTIFRRIGIVQKTRKTAP